MIYCISKRIEISACHRLELSYESKCTQMHGHNWIITVYMAASQKNKDGMVYDFSHIRKEIHDYLDHGNLNELLPFNPTAENIAEWVVGRFPQCYRCIVQESEGNTAQAYDDTFPIQSQYLM